MPRLCIIGPMVGRNRDCVTTQGEKLSDLFAAAGYTAISASAWRNPWRRLADIVRTLVERRRDFDVVILNVYGGPSFIIEDAASRIARGCGKRLLMCLRGGAMPTFMASYPRWTRRVLDRADAIVTPSAFLARCAGARGYRAIVIPNVIDLPAYPYRLRTHVRPRMFWMRSFHDVYNPLLAVRVLALVRKVLPGATLVMAGQDKGMEAETRQAASRMGIEDAVRFPGFLDMAAKGSEGNRADIFLNTNRIDNMPVAVIEACAMGLPVVATAVGGVPDLLEDGRTGILTPDDDAVAMASAVRRLVRTPPLAAELSANGRVLAEGCTWERIRPQWERLFSPAAAMASYGG